MACHDTRRWRKKRARGRRKCGEERSTGNGNGKRATFLAEYTDQLVTPAQTPTTQKQHEHKASSKHGTDALVTMVIPKPTLRRPRSTSVTLTKTAYRLVQISWASPLKSLLHRFYSVKQVCLRLLRVRYLHSKLRKYSLYPRLGN